AALANAWPWWAMHVFGRSPESDPAFVGGKSTLADSGQYVCDPESSLPHHLPDVERAIKQAHRFPDRPPPSADRLLGRRILDGSENHSKASETHGCADSGNERRGASAGPPRSARSDGALPQACRRFRDGREPIPPP